MTPRQWELVKELYHAALECSPEQRASFLERNELDEMVRAEVQRLLGLHNHLGTFLSRPPFIDPLQTGANSTERLIPGQVLAGRFRIVNFVAAGGMGEIYKAEDLLLDRIVALKLLPNELAEDRESLEQFLREAKTASALNHPNICTVYDFGEDAARAFIAMQYLEGETLSARIQRAPLSTVEALTIAIAVGGALGAAHRRGIVHRDLKPGNIMLTESGAMLLDFGLAKYERPAVSAEETLTGLTGNGSVVGTLPYMSPEQLQGQKVDARGDIFAFGAVLYEMLAGKKAFQRKSNSEALMEVDREEPIPLDEFIQDVPNGLDRMIRRCLRKRAEERYASMAEVEQELKSCYELALEPAGGSTLSALFRRTRQPRVAIPALVILVALMSLAGWGIRHSTSDDEGSHNQAAHIAFVRGCLELEKKNEPAFWLALGYFREAVSADPKYAQAYAKISETYINLASNIANAPAYANAKLAAETAIRLDGHLADAHRNLAWLKLTDESDPKGAEIEYLKSLRMNDNDGRTHHWYAQLLLAERRPVEAIKEAQRGIELDPLGLGSNYNYAFILLRAGRPREGILHLEKLLQREPGNEVVLGYLGLGYEELGQYGKAAEYLGKAAKASKLKYQYEASMVYPLAKNGALADAQRIAQELLSKKNSGQWIPGYNLAVMYVGLRDFDNAFYWLGQCHIDRSCSLLEVETNPIRQELSSDPRFGPLERAFGGASLETALRREFVSPPVRN